MVSAIAILLFIVAVSATMIIPMSDTGKANSQAQEHSPVFNDEDIGRIDFIHYAKPTGAVKPPKTTTCYKLMGVSWKSLPVSYVINTTTEENHGATFVETAIKDGAEAWDTASSKELFNDAYTIDTHAEYGQFDGKNVIQFSNYDDSNVIAVTSVWYYRPTRGIVEFDMLFNEYYSWGDADEGYYMDVQNIATHEMGHAVGLADLYTNSCGEVTMFGYSGYNETKKRDLEPQDITGLQKIYGP